jgi:hypothetical protein
MLVAPTAYKFATCRYAALSGAWCGYKIHTRLSLESELLLNSTLNLIVTGNLRISSVDFKSMFNTYACNAYAGLATHRQS